MKKIICLTLSLMMVMSLVAVPVMAEDTATTTTSTMPDPNYHLTAATVNDTGKLIDDETHAKYGQYNIGSVYWNPVLLNEVNSNRAVRIHNIMSDGSTAPVEARLNGVYVSDGNGATTWDGFKVDATEELTISKLNSGTKPGKYIAIASTGAFNGADIRVDSVRFMMPAADEAAAADDKTPMTLLFGYDNDNYYNNEALKQPTLRLMNGGAYIKDLSYSYDDYKELIAAGTMETGKWYRAERILDTRIDSGVHGDGTENWQRYIIYDDATGAIIGSSGWVKTCTTSASATTKSYKEYPFACTAYSAINYPEGSFIYFDDFKAWALNAPTSDYEVGDLSGKPKYLEFPKAHTADMTRTNYSLGMSTIDKYYYPGKGYDGVDHKTERSAFRTAALGSKYIYMQQDVMITEANTTSFGLMDVSYEGTSMSRMKSVPTASPIKVENGTIKVYGWDTTKTTKNKFTSAVKNAAQTETFEVDLEPGKWYTVQLKIDQSEYCDTLGFYGYVSGATSTNNKQYVLDENGEKVTITTADTTKAIVTVTDSENNVYTTEEFTFKDPNSYFQSGLFYSIFWADATMASTSSSGTTDVLTGMKVYLDNQKMTLSDTTIDAEDAWVVFEENFEGQDLGEGWPEFVFEQFNPKTAEDVTGLSNLFDANNLAQVTVDKVKCDDIPASAAIALGVDIDATNLADIVSLYQGTSEVSDMLANAVYDANTGILTVYFGALEPNTTYTVKVDRAATNIEGNIFAVLPGNTGATADFTFKTGYSESQPFKFTASFVADDTTLEDWDCPLVDLEDMDISSASILESFSESPSNYVVIAALYDAYGRMEDIMTQTGTIDSSTPVTVDFEGATLVPTAETAELRAFVWNTWSLMTPKAGDPYVYPAE